MTTLGTLCQVRNLIGRSNVKIDPTKDFDACEDFLITVVKSLIVAGIMEMLNMKSLDNTPVSSIVPENCMEKRLQERKAILTIITKNFMEKLVKFQFNGSYVPGEDLLVEYQTQILSIGLFYLVYRDSIKEGDGIRLLLC